MPIEVGLIEEPAGDEYGRPGDWFRGVGHLERVSRFGGELEGCGAVARFLDAWERANGGSPFARDGSRRMQSWPAFCGGRERWVALIAAEPVARRVPVPEPFDWRDL